MEEFSLISPLPICHLLELFHVMCCIQTHSANRQTVDSAGSGTAMMTGEKVQSATLGVSWKVNRTKCESAFGNELKTILDHSQAEGIYGL